MTTAKILRLRLFEEFWSQGRDLVDVNLCGTQTPRRLSPSPSDKVSQDAGLSSLRAAAKDA